jgi:dCTP deaminase
MTFWSDRTWSALKDEDAPVVPFDRGQLEEAKYIMAIGEQVYVSSSKAEHTVTYLKEDERFTISPGQFAYILTHETVRLRDDMIGFISINATTKFYGLVNISGFHIDPGYVGKIMFSVFNAGPSVIHLKRGDRLFPMWIANLDQPASTFPTGRGFKEIPGRLVTSISGNFTTAIELKQDVERLKSDVSSLKSNKWQMLIFIGLLALFLSGFLRDIGTESYRYLEQHYSWFGLRLSDKAPHTQPPNQ